MLGGRIEGCGFGLPLLGALWVAQHRWMQADSQRVEQQWCKGGSITGDWVLYIEAGCSPDETVAIEYMPGFTD